MPAAGVELVAGDVTGLAALRALAGVGPAPADLASVACQNLSFPAWPSSSMPWTRPVTAW